jgi:hypothetical protein
LVLHQKLIIFWQKWRARVLRADSRRN